MSSELISALQTTVFANTMVCAYSRHRNNSDKLKYNISIMLYSAGTELKFFVVLLHFEEVFFLFILIDKFDQQLFSVKHSLCLLLYDIL